jgi:hypothetical protein
MKKAILTMAGDTLHVILQQPPKEGPHLIDYLPWAIAAVALAVFILIYWHRIKRTLSFIRLKEYKVSIVGIELSGALEYNAAAQEAAWKIYIELSTRITGNALAPGTGILREALNSLYAAFGSLRDTLKAAGAELAKPPSTDKQFTVASLLLIVMNDHIRPFLSKWHPLLQEYEKTRPDNVAQFSHEQAWSENVAFRDDLNRLMQLLQGYIKALKEITEGKTGAA